MDIAGVGKRVRIYIGEQDRASGRHEPLWQTILELLRTEGAAGATMVRGLAGFGAHSQLHTARLADIAPDLPVVLEWIDGPERISRVLPKICELVITGMVTVEDIEIVKYTHRAPHAVPPDRVGDVMTREVISVRTDTPLVDTLAALLDRGFRALPVVDAQDHVEGIITNGDLVERGGLHARLELLDALGSRPLDPRQELRTAADVMTTPVVSIGPDAPLRDAVHLMVQDGVKRLPVVDTEGRLVGMLSRVDVLRTMGEDYHAPFQPTPSLAAVAHSVADLMRTDVPTVAAEASLGEVLDAVTSTRLNRAIVVDDERHVLGVVSDADLLGRLDPAARSGVLGALMRRGPLTSDVRLKARDVMIAPPVTVAVDTPVLDAARQMLNARRKILPITDAHGRLVGAIDRADLLRYVQHSEGQ